MFKLLKVIGNFFTFWVKIERRYDKIKGDETKRENSVSLGVRSVIQSIVCGALTVLALWGLSRCVANFTSGFSHGLPVLTIIGMVVTAFCALALFVQGVVGGLLYMVYQLKLNKKAVGFAALVVWILVIAAIVVLALLMFGGVL